MNKINDICILNDLSLLSFLNNFCVVLQFYLRIVNLIFKTVQENRTLMTFKFPIIIHIMNIKFRSSSHAMSNRILKYRPYEEYVNKSGNIFRN